MPAIAPNSLVLVTGASGFIAIHCVRILLEGGYRVRATVRSADKGEYIAGLLGARYPGKFEYVLVEDMEREGAFDAAAAGVAGVLHTASPFHFDSEGRALDALINPAVNGTKNVLRSVLKADTVQRVVVTSSFASIADFTATPSGRAITETEWNEFSVAQSKEQGNSQGAVHAYQASKALAERAAWDFVETHKPVWDLATICPPYVYGPPIQQVASADKLNTSVSIIWGLLHGNKTEADLLSPAGSVVDVRDVARAHVLALATPAAGGHRFATSIGAVTWQDMVDAVHASDAVPAEWKKNVPVGTRGGGKEVVQDTLRGDKAAAQLGLKYHTLAQTIEDTTKALVDADRRGFKGYPSDEIVNL